MCDNENQKSKPLSDGDAPVKRTIREQIHRFIYYRYFRYHNQTVTLLKSYFHEE